MRSHAFSGSTKTWAQPGHPIWFGPKNRVGPTNVRAKHPIYTNRPFFDEKSGLAAAKPLVNHGAGERT